MMTPQVPDGRQKDVDPLCWGVREGTPKIAAMSGYGWNPNINAWGYGYLKLHLMNEAEADDRDYVIGGGTLIPESRVDYWNTIPDRETYSQFGLQNASKIDTWGNQNGIVQFCARATGWN